MSYLLLSTHVTSDHPGWVRSRFTRSSFSSIACTKGGHPCDGWYWSSSVLPALCLSVLMASSGGAQCTIPCANDTGAGSIDLITRCIAVITGDC